jgi:hypothetical protein
MGIRTFIRRLAGSDRVLGKSPGSRPVVPVRLCEFGHPVSGNKLCGYGHRAARAKAGPRE